MARFLQVALHIHHGIAKGGTGFGTGHFHRFNQIFAALYHAHTAPAAAAGSFDDYGETHLVANGDDFIVVFGQSTVGAGHARHAGGNHGVFGGNFVAHQTDGFGTRADKGKAGLLYLLGKAVVFGQEAVAGVDGVGTGDFGGGNNRRNV